MRWMITTYGHTESNYKLTECDTMRITSPVADTVCAPSSSSSAGGDFCLLVGVSGDRSDDDFHHFHFKFHFDCSNETNPSD